MRETSSRKKILHTIHSLFRFLFLENPLPSWFFQRFGMPLHRLLDARRQDRAVAAGAAEVSAVAPELGSCRGDAAH
jgi:hypothetical protein